MTELLTAAQMRAIEQAAIASGEVTGLELMERAGRGVVDAILEWRPELADTSHRAVVLCGPGNNGGDGFVVARILHQRGWDVEVLLYGVDPENLAKLPPNAAENARRWRDLGEVEQLLNTTRLPADCVVIDALFGTGLSRPIEGLGDLQWLVEDGADCFEEGTLTTPVIAIDIASGICADSGRGLETSNAGVDTCISANLTITFHRSKIGHFCGVGSLHCRELRVVDIGLTETRPADATYLSVPSPALSRPLSSSGHKYLHGHALILCGGPGKGGAARLAARGALRIGAGLVTVGCPSDALTENAARLDAIMLAEVESADALSKEIADRKMKAVCIGPGFGTGARPRKFLAELLKGGEEPRPTLVLDADALTEFRDDPDTLFGMLHENCVLTPHEGEFGRLFPDILARLKKPATRGPAYSKVDATREAAKRAGCVVLFKGADTVIADPSGRSAINSAHYERAAPWLATAGSGDVLAGFITGLLARGFSPMQAAETAAWLHVECALKFGPGLIAEDIPEQLPAVFRDLGL